MKTEYIRFYEKEEDAFFAMRRHNRIIKTLKHRISDIHVMLDGPDDNFAVVDINTAIKMEMPYEWAV